MIKIPFNIPAKVGRELEYINESIASGKISGDGIYTTKCHEYFLNRYSIEHCLLTTSCTDALEMCGLLLSIEPGDEVIMPTYTFVSTANAFSLRGAKIRFVDSCIDHPNINAQAIEELINPKTKAIVVVHYAGVACDMGTVMRIAADHNLAVVEDAAQAVDSYYKDRLLGTIGDFGTYSFHETKNVTSGEGGLLIVRDKLAFDRAEIIREKGTNRSAFFRGEVDKYGWVDLGSSFLPSDMNAAYLYAQLEEIDTIQNRRKDIYKAYHDFFSSLVSCGEIEVPVIPPYATNNAHMFYLVLKSPELRTFLIGEMRRRGVLLAFHYQSLHASKFYRQHDVSTSAFPNAKRFSDCLVRLPIYYGLKDDEVNFVCENIAEILGLK